MACNPPSPLISVIVASSINEIQSHRIFPSGVQRSNALANRELGLRADPHEPWLVLAEPVVVRNPEPLQRCPRLPLGRDVLALVFADGALSRWASLRGYCVPQALQMNAGMVSPV